MHPPVLHGHRQGHESSIATSSEVSKSPTTFEYLEITHNISQTDKDNSDLLYILHGRSDRSKTKVDVNVFNLMNKIEVFLKYKTSNIVRHTRNPLCLLLKMIKKSNLTF